MNIGGINIIKELLLSMRPKQWYKNLVIFVSLVFSLNLTNIDMWLSTILGFVIFCMLSGSEYILNDILDRKKDKNHPEKCKRPIASGKIKISYASIFVIFLIVVSFLASYLISIQFLLTSLVFLLLILSYSLFLKRYIIVDVLVISSGFVIRAIAGVVIGFTIDKNVDMSPWLVICAFLLALFLALGKRRHELALLGINAKAHRQILQDYSATMLDQMISITTAALIISYSLYTFLTEDLYMMLTIPVVIYGLFKYLFLIHAKNFGGEPEMLFKDKGLVVSMGLWILLVLIILYGIPRIGISILSKFV